MNGVFKNFNVIDKKENIVLISLWMQEAFKIDL